MPSPSGARLGYSHNVFGINEFRSEYERFVCIPLARVCHYWLGALLAVSVSSLHPRYEVPEARISDVVGLLHLYQTTYGTPGGN